MPDNTVCVDRSTPFGNPFPICACTSYSMGQEKRTWSIGSWNGPALWFRDTKEEASELSVKAFRAWIESPANETLREKAKIALRGKNLACWCQENQSCHASVLLEIANG